MRALLGLTAAFPAALYSVGASVVPRDTQADPIHCVMTDPLSCPTTNDLSWSPGFAAAVTRFIGNKKADLIRHNWTLSSQALYGLGGPPDPRKPLPGGLFLFAACPAHNCAGQAAAIVLNGQGRIEGIGISSFHFVPGIDFDRRYLDFYVRRGPTAETVISALTDWGHGPNIRSLLQNPKVDDGLGGRTAIELLQ